MSFGRSDSITIPPFHDIKEVFLLLEDGQPELVVFSPVQSIESMGASVFRIISPPFDKINSANAFSYHSLLNPQPNLDCFAQDTSIKSILILLINPGDLTGLPISCLDS